MMILIFINLFQIPFRLAFGTDGHSEDEIPMYIGTDVAVDIIFILDVVLKLTRFAFIEDGELVTEPKKFYHKYRHDGWLIYDLIACLPLYYPNMLVLVFFRLPKLVKVLQIPDYFDFLQVFIYLVNLFTVR